jgi:methionyl-tRNA synthetase
MAAGLPLPKKVFAHGWLLFEQDKMSKSRGNIVRPKPIAAVMGMDPLRLFLLREIVFGQDGNFSYDALVQRYNADLANGIGNLASRTFAMINQYSEGKVPAAGPGDAQIAGIARAAASQMLECFDRLDFTRGMDGIWTLVSAVDKFIVERAPWKLAKDPASRPSLEETLYTAAEAVRLLCVMLYPVMPESMPKIWSQLGMTSSLDDAREADLAWGGLPAGQALGKVSGVFPRLDPGPAVRKMQELEIAERARQNAILGRKEESAAETPAAEAAAGMVEGISPLAPEITIDDFAKIDLRVGLVKTAEKVKGSDKLLHLTVDIGEAAGPRTIVAGIALAYEPETLLGRKVVIVANLAPRKLKGITSQGMIVAASLEGGSPVLASFLEDVPVGARLR